MRAALDWFHRAPLTTRAIIWAALAGFTFSALNTLLRHLTMNMHPFQAQFLRYLMGALVMLPLIIWYVKPKFAGREDLAVGENIDLSQFMTKESAHAKA